MPDIVDLESDDTDVVDEKSDSGDDAPPDACGESPFGAKTKVIKPPIWKIYAIQPKHDHDNKNEKTPNGLVGMIWTAAHPSHQYTFVQPVYKEMIDVLEDCHVINHVFDHSINGIFQKQSKNPRYNKRAIVWIFPADKQTIDQRDIKWIYDKYVYWIFKKGLQKEKKDFHIDFDTDVEYVSSWSKYITLEDLEDIFKRCHLATSYKGIKSYFRHSANNLYSYWPVGEIPVKDMVKYKLREIAHSSDVARLNAYEASLPKSKPSSVTKDTKNPYAKNTSPAANLEDATSKAVTNSDQQAYVDACEVANIQRVSDDPFANTDSSTSSTARQLAYENADHPSESPAHGTSVSTPTNLNGKRVAKTSDKKNGGKKSKNT